MIHDCDDCCDDDHEYGPATRVERKTSEHITGAAADVQVRMQLEKGRGFYVPGSMEELSGIGEVAITRKPLNERLSPGLMEELQGLSVDVLPGEPTYRGPGFPVETTQWPAEAVRYSERDARLTLKLMEAQDEATRLERKRKIKQALLLLAVFVLGYLLGGYVHG